MRELELMGTLGCCLCDEAAALVVTQLETLHLSVYQVDIVDDNLLLEQYGIRIPVLVDLETKRELDWPFDSLELKAFIEGLA